MPDSPAAPVTTDRPRLLLLDGHSLAYRAFFALPVENFSTTTGQHTNAVYGFTSMLINVLRDERPTHVGVAFDVSRQTFRSEEYADYKANRSTSPDRVLRPGLAGQGGARGAADRDHREGRLRGRRRDRHAGHAGGRPGLRGADLHGRPRLVPARRRHGDGALPEPRRLGDGADDARGRDREVRRAARAATPSWPRWWGSPPTTCPGCRGSAPRRPPSGSRSTTASTT